MCTCNDATYGKYSSCCYYIYIYIIYSRGQNGGGAKNVSSLYIVLYVYTYI
jgi:hypothetical protein